MTATAVLIAAAMMTLALALAMTAAWRIWLRTRNAGWIDVTWTIAVGATGFITALAPLGPEPRRSALVAAAVAAWAARLAPHLIARTRAHSDDPRYHALVRQWGASATQRMLGLCMGQALAAVPLVLAVWLASHNVAAPLGLRDGLAVAVLLAGIAGAGLADRQLHRFREHSGGAICQVGLWRYSRHPNYFFEFLGWCAYPVFAVAVGAPWGWLALAAPIVIYFKLVHVSGIPSVEQHMLRTRGDAYEGYIARTSAFVPLPGRSPPPGR
jgi:steroid 5-alpha reductase family enzyme